MQPYSYYLEQEDGVYRYIFVSKNSIKYSIYFAAAEDFFDLTVLPNHLKTSGYNFGITPINEDETIKIPLDIRIKYTLCAIVKDFFSIVPQAILMVNYDNHDSREAKRFFCFDRWFSDLNIDGMFIKEDSEILLPEVTYKITIILYSDNKYIKEIMQEFYEVKNALVEGK